MQLKDDAGHAITWKTLWHFKVAVYRSDPIRSGQALSNIAVRTMLVRSRQLYQDGMECMPGTRPVR